MGKRGKSPSLIGGGAGACKFRVAKRKRTCKRCECSIIGGTDCVEINIPATMGRKSFCIDCFMEILDQTRSDLNDLVAQAKLLQS